MSLRGTKTFYIQLIKFSKYREIYGKTSHFGHINAPIIPINLLITKINGLTQHNFARFFLYTRLNLVTLIYLVVNESSPCRR